jgi:Carboxypeptidase regulatory-like domain/TonB dependent receptor
MARWSVLIACLALLPTAVADVAAQTVSATSGAIVGKVTDATGAVLPGVTVTATSPSMQGQQVAVTNQEGSYRIPSVPPGDYRIAYEIVGFTTIVREGIRVGLGFTATVNVELRVATLQETVTVSGESPVVDTSSTKTVTNFDSERLATLLGARDLWAIMAMAPGISLGRIDVAGNRAGTQSGYSAYDTKTQQHRPMVEGMVMTEGTGAAMFYYDYGTIDEVAVGTGAHSSDMGWPGVQSQFVSKSGGNAFHGVARYDYQNENIQSYNIDAAQIATGLRGGGGLEPQDLNRMSSYYDVNADVGGYIKKDKLWFYVSGRDQDIKVRLVNFPVKPFQTRLRNYSGKGTYSLSQNNKLIVYSQGGRKQQPNRLDTHQIGATTAIHNSEESTWNQDYTGLVHKAEWNSVLSDKAFFEVRAGKAGYDWPNYRHAETQAYVDRGTNEVRGGNREWQQDRQRAQVLGSFTWFQEGWAGSHSFKFGSEAFREIRRDHRGNAEKTLFVNDVQHVYNRAAPIEVFLFETPSRNDSRLKTTSLYANDTWNVSSKVTLNLGLRFDRYRHYLPEQEHSPGQFNQFITAPIKFAAVDELVVWNLWAPRIGVTYDISGNGKTVLKFNYGYYWWNPSTDMANAANPNSGEWFRQYQWTDPNGNGRYDRGEEGTLIRSTGGTAGTAIDPNIEDTRTDEVAIWAERELMENFGVRAGFVYRRISQFRQQFNANRPFNAFNVPVTIPDPGPDGRAGTADDGRPIQGFNLDPAVLARPTLNLVQNFPGEAEFYSIDLSATKRLSNRWSLLGGLGYRWNYDLDSGYAGNNLRSADWVAVNPNEIINTVDGRYEFKGWGFKMNGTWETPWYGVVLSPSLRHQAGQPFGRTILATMNYGSQRILTEPLDSQRQSNFTLVDLRVEKGFKLGGTKRAAGFLDIYNLTNTNAEENLIWGSGATFLQPTVIVGPRIVRFGVKFDW